MRRDSSITEIKGIGEKTKKLFEKMGVYTVGDILLHFPRNYIQYPHPVPIDEMTAEHMQTEDKLAIVARIERTPVTRNGRHMQVTLLVIGSPGHQIQCRSRKLCGMRCWYLMSLPVLHRYRMISCGNCCR